MFAQIASVYEFLVGEGKLKREKALSANLVRWGFFIRFAPTADHLAEKI